MLSTGAGVNVVAQQDEQRPGFRSFASAIAAQFKQWHRQRLFRVNIDKDALWTTYLSSFPPGSNPMFKQRTEHDCQTCKSFIRAVGGVVTVGENGELQACYRGALG